MRVMLLIHSVAMFATAMSGNWMALAWVVTATIYATGYFKGKQA